MKKRKELNLGCSDFKDVIENNNYYVDKSLFIRDIIKSENMVSLLPRPRRFGKTLNLSMLNYYFDINEPENQKLFTELNIWKTEDEIKQKQGKYPVIFISFKEAKQNNWEECYEIIINEIASVYKRFNYLNKVSFFSDEELSTINKIKNRTAKKIDYQLSIKNLSEYLYRYNNQKVVILIDEYDVPIQAGYKKFYEEVVTFVRGLMSAAFKDNKFLYKGVITGILRVSKESIFSGLNNISVYSILEGEFSDKFGFTETETKQIIEDFDLSDNYEQIKNWYNGYKFGNTTDIYNPWSILNYLLRFQNGFKPYWAQTSSNDLIKDLLTSANANETRELFLKLINNETIEKTITENFVFPELDQKPELLWTLLTFSGYLTIVNNVGKNIYELRIPNFEVKMIFQDIILNWLNIEVKVKYNLLIETTKHLINNRLDEFEIGFKQIMGDTFSYFDLHGQTENVYQSYVLGLLAIVGDDYIIKSNRESGTGRYDIMLVPHDKLKNGIVIEIKQITKTKRESKKTFTERIKNKIIEAQNQIEDNKYYKNTNCFC